MLLCGEGLGATDGLGVTDGLAVFLFSGVEVGKADVAIAVSFGCSICVALDTKVLVAVTETTNCDAVNAVGSGSEETSPLCISAPIMTNRPPIIDAITMAKASVN